jgi:type IV pilus assembly protein PilW
MQLLENDIIHAGFWGTYVPQFDNLSITTAPTDAPNAAPDPCLAYTSWSSAYKTNLLGISVQSYDTAPASCSAIVLNQQPGTDMLVVRHAETCVPGVGNCAADTAGALYFQSSLCETENATPYQLDTTGFTLHNRDCTTLADKRKFISNIYYIRSYANTVGDGIPTLMRSSFDLSNGVLAQQAAQPLIEGVDGLHVELGIDSLSRCGHAIDYTHAISYVNPLTCAVDAVSTNNTQPDNRGDGTVDGAFVHCTSGSPCNVAQQTNTVVAKLYVLARASSSSSGYTDTKTYTLGSSTLGPYNDGYKRHVFMTSIQLANVSGRRETP